MLEQLSSRTSFAVTELERFADCSSAWFVERFLDPRTIDAEPDAKQRGSVAHNALYRFFSRVPAELGVEKLEPQHVEAATGLMRRCLDEALAGVRMDLTEMQERELDQTLWRDLAALVEEECESPLPLVPRRFEVSFGSDRAAPELQRGLELAPGLTLSGKIDRIDVDPFGARGSCRTTSPARARTRRDRSRASCGSRSRSTCSSSGTSSGSSRSAGSTGPSPARASRAASFATRRRRRCRATSRTTTSTRRRSGAWSSRRARPPRPRRADAAGGRPPRPARRRVPDLVRPLADVPDRAAPRAGEPRSNEQQLAAVEAGGEVFVSAGAGTGKTAVLVERVVRAVCDRGLDVDSILVITYTRRAAGELRTRIRAALAERGRHDLARELDGAWISTIHGFCARLLKAYPLAAGLDPRFRELDEAQAAVLRSEAFGEALAEFCSGDDPQRLELLATYGSDRLRRMLTSVYETLRAAGRELDLAVAARPELGERVDELRGAATLLAADSEATDAQQRTAAELLELLERDQRPDRLMSLSGFKARGDRAAGYCEALAAVEQAALDEAAARDRALLQELLTLFAERYAAGEGARVGARLRGSPARGARPAPVAARAPRTRAGALPLDPRGRVPGHEPPADGDRRPAAHA